MGAQPAFLCLTFLNIVFSNSANAHVLNTVLQMTNFSSCGKDFFTKFLKLIDFEQIDFSPLRIVIEVGKLKTSCQC